MFVIGLTGPTGAGKSTVSRALSDHGFFVADGDAYARLVTVKGSSVLSALARAFGDDIILPSGELDRRMLAARAFSSPDGTALLNAVMHPPITERIFTDIKRAGDAGFDTAVVDAAALLESGIADKCDLIAVVTAPPEIRLARILARDGLTQTEALRRMEAQKNEAYYERFADIIIRNYPPYLLENELQKLYDAAGRKRYETAPQS